MNKSKGMTLIELMIAMGILVVLASIALPAYIGHVKTSRLSEANSVIHSINLAQSEFFLENNNYFGPVANGADFAVPSNNIFDIAPADTEYFDFSVSNGPCGNLINCYTITATGKNEMAGEPNVVFDGP